MMSDRPSTDDLETLSALFDGALRDDAARFARKRLGHDVQWQQACGRWQLIGDALRGQATAAAPGDFAQRVHDAVANEPVPVLVPEALPAPRGAAAVKRRVPMWIGGALAASLAAVAVFVGRPAVEGPDVEPAPTLVVAPSVSAPASPAAAALPVAPVADPGPTALARAPAAPPRIEPQASRRPEAMLAARASTDRIARDIQRSVEADARVADIAPDPFRPATEFVTRPWPRAVLPNSQAAGALTASFEAPSVEARSFYPFEPPVQAPEPREP